MEKEKIQPTAEENNFDPEMIIHGIMDEVMRRGANDYEASAFASILQAYHNKIITGQEAIRQAENIRDSKNDYH